MPIRRIYKGDIFAATTQCIVNPVNLHGVMGLGLAKQFKIRYPDMFIKYKHACDDNIFMKGMLQVVPEHDYLIVNFPTKVHWGTNGTGGDIELIRSGLETLARTYKDRGITSITFPPIGCGAGGLDYYGLVLPLIKEVLTDIDLIVDLIEP